MLVSSIRLRTLNSGLLMGCSVILIHFIKERCMNYWLQHFVYEIFLRKLLALANWQLPLIKIWCREYWVKVFWLSGRSRMSPLDQTTVLNFHVSQLNVEKCSSVIPPMRYLACAYIEWLDYKDWSLDLSFIIDIDDEVEGSSCSMRTVYPNRMYGILITVVLLFTVKGNSSLWLWLWKPA